MAQAQVESELRTIKLSDLVFDDQNPRRDVGDISELRDSIRSLGVLEPIVVRPSNGHFGVIAGRRRWAAAREAGLTEIPAMVTGLSDEDAAAASLIENLQRKDLTPIEEAIGYNAWLDLTKKSQSDLAKAVGKAPSTIANALRVLDAAAPIQKALERGDITLAHAKIAMTLPEKALPLIDLKAGVSVRELEEQAKDAQRSYTAIERIRAAIAKAEAAGKDVTWDTSDRDLYLGGAEVNLKRAFGEPKKKLVGRIQRGYSVTSAIHDQVCDCEAVVIGYQGQLEPACVSPTGWKKAQARERTNMGKASPQKKKKVQSAAAKASRLRAVEKQSTAEAAKAYAGTNLRSWSGMTTKVAPKYFSGGITGEPARLVLFGLVAKYADARGPMWKLELWKKIAAAPLKDVRAKVDSYLLGLAFRQIADASQYQDKYGNTRKIRALVDAHFAGGKPKKAAKR